MDLEGKSAIVTGAAAGIGFATAKRLAAEGCAVTMWDLDGEAVGTAASTVRENASREVFAHQCDVTDFERVTHLTETAVREMGRIDILVNNAGHLAPGNFLDQSMETWTRTIEVNFTAVTGVTRAVLPHMWDRGRGHVVNVASAASYVGVPGMAVYSASKWAVLGLTEALRHEARNAGRCGLRFSSVHPNYVMSGMFAGARMKGLGALILPRLRSHDVVAKAIVESALKRGRRCPRRPRSLRLSPFLRGILPDSLFGFLVRGLNVHKSMSTWVGREGDSEP